MRPSSLFFAFAFFVFIFNARAQELKTQPTPFSVWLDFQKLAASAPRPPFPIWLESFQRQQKKNYEGKIVRTTFRLRFRRLGDLNAEMLLRVMFDDQAGTQPSVTAWSELGERKFFSKPLGAALGLATTESLMIPMSGVDYIDVEVAGDGANVNGAFLSSLQTSSVKRAVDFDPPAPLADPFENAPAKTTDEDTFLLGRVKATLAVDPVKITPQEPMVAFDFSLDAQPEISLLTFEILNGDVTAPLQISVNDKALGEVAPIVPDLADPAFLPNVRPLDADVRVPYAGWMRCQKAIPTSALRSGENRIVLSLDPRSAAVAIRNVEVQLKQP